MQISVKLLGTYRSKLPEGSQNNTCQIDVPPGTVVREVVKKFEIAYDQGNVILLNGHVPEPDQELEEGDVVCILSALAGG